MKNLQVSPEKTGISVPNNSILRENLVCHVSPAGLPWFNHRPEREQSPGTDIALLYNASKPSQRSYRLVCKIAPILKGSLPCALSSCDKGYEHHVILLLPRVPPEGYIHVA